MIGLLAEKRAQVAIVGAGPVGLLLAACLIDSGLDCVLLEERSRITTHSRSIGIHPVSLELFARLGIESRFLEKGLRVEGGLAFHGVRQLGRLAFAPCRGPFRFVLSLPQQQTEELLEGHVTSLRPRVLCREARVVAVSQNTSGVRIEYLSNGVSHRLDADFAVACDGKRSALRNALGIAFHGGQYADRFVMGDFEDNTPYGTDAAVFLHFDGLIESLPLPWGRRRWVVRTAKKISTVERVEVESRVQYRTGHDLSACRHYMLSSFEPEHYVASSFSEGRVALAGDAAHIVSPIGGQGLNLGWLGAERLAGQLGSIVNGKKPFPEAFASYEQEQRRAARRAIRRAEWNMMIGRGRKHPTFRNAIVRCLLKTPLKIPAAKVFTMRGLYSWPI